MRGATHPASTKEGDAHATNEIESDPMTSQRTTSAAPPKLGRWRRFSIWTLILVASLIAVVGISTLWVKRQVLDDKAWSDASADVIADPDVRNALSIFLVNQLYDNVDVAAAIENRLPEGAKSIAGTLAGALRQPATNAINQLLARPRVQQLFINASSAAHDHHADSDRAGWLGPGAAGGEGLYVRSTGRLTAGR